MSTRKHETGQPEPCIPASQSTAGGSSLVIQPKLMIGQADDPYERQADQVADQVVRGASPGSVRFGSEFAIQRKCSDCEKEDETLPQKSPLIQKKGMNTGTFAGEAISSQIEASRGAGNPMNATTQRFMESRFGNNFSGVRIHTDTRAIQLSQDLNAQAFTVGNDVYFNAGRYNPETTGGQHLLAHELTHTLQQGGGLNRRVQRQAEEMPSLTLSCPESTTAPPQVAQGIANRTDARATAIITRAQNSDAISVRAMRLVSDIICTYYPSQAGKIRNIRYNASEAGLHVFSVGSGATTRADLNVGDYFINNASSFARRVLQVGHELMHVEQYRTGMAGGHKSDEREFLAFYWESLTDEFEGTGRMSHGTRKNLIDGALGYYYCLSAALQTTHDAKKQTLLTRRATVDGTRGNAPTPAPTACSR
ncbi:uncharacterized protein DUF4157 [Dyadobacter jejuensis]|uniref:Uncharacterized protein DUF4157 n=1 Tax=Dyadobacter jejuensis TaxID=1082580 RepID=A0A316AJR0_9BACT|nr:DUF4157 domain-containing protein [Dyadobacter jejuensis]PWJ57479.1 uncharacterized protein DUF4157 [Dyadobacter jejuensis]